MTSKKVVLLTNREDITADYVVLELQKRDISFYRFNTEDFPLRVQLSWTIFADSFNGLLTNPDGEIELSEIKSVWYRRPSVPTFDSLELEQGIKDFCVKESYYGLEGIWSTLDCFWISNPINIRRSENKPYQLKIASELGFQIPRTLISNKPTDITAFFKDSGENIIIKPVRTGIIKRRDSESIVFTNEVSASALSKLKDSIPIPSIYQEKIPKKYDIRVTVIGDMVFPTEIHSQEFQDSSTDWRRGENPQIVQQKHKLPADLEEKCISLVKKLGLEFAAIDLVMTPGNNYVFLEINPNGQWAWIEERTGYKLTEALVNLLCSQA